MMMGSASAARRNNSGYAAKLNLVSLMDIFTILVFFLLLNSGDAQNLEKAKFVTLPDSSASGDLHDDLIVLVAEGQIYLGDIALADSEAVMKQPHKLIEPLAAALLEYTERREAVTPYEKANGFSITIMGDESVPYVLLKSVMATCSAQNFRDISLAVNRIAGSHFAAAATVAGG